MVQQVHGWDRTTQEANSVIAPQSWHIPTLIGSIPEMTCSFSFRRTRAKSGRSEPMMAVEPHPHRGITGLLANNCSLIGKPVVRNNILDKVFVHVPTPFLVLIEAIAISATVVPRAALQPIGVMSP